METNQIETVTLISCKISKSQKGGGSKKREAWRKQLYIPQFEWGEHLEIFKAEGRGKRGGQHEQGLHVECF